MVYSDEQKDVIESTGDLLVNAVAGSGKTSTLIAYAEKNRKSRILYIAFNKSVMMEAKQKFKQKSLRNVHVVTAHSLALRHFSNKKIQIKQGASYSAFDARRILGFRRKNIVDDMKFGKHVIQISSCFCNSSEAKVSDVEYLNFLKNDKERIYVSSCYDELLYASRNFLKKMMDAEIDLTHDFYLKQFQLEKPQLDYDTLFFDEGQDASPVMLDIFLNQKGNKIIVGDEHQQIYRWRYAVNALKEVPFNKKHLNTSFRFPQSIADLSKDILETKSLLKEGLGNANIPNIKGNGTSRDLKTKAILGRTNSALLIEAINLLIEDKAVSNVYFEGNFNSYTYADEGGSIYDVLNLYLENRSKIRDPLIKSFKSLFELEEYADETDDSPMKGLIGIVNTYKKELPSLIKEIKAHHVEDDCKDEAEIVFSTVHKAKGMEYDEVTLLNDYLGEERLKAQIDRVEGVDFKKLEEDINILYVAATRTKNVLNIPQSILPLSFENKNSSNINILKEDENKPDDSTILTVVKTYTLEEKRERNTQAYEKWTDEKDIELMKMTRNGKSTQELSEHFNRSKGAIRSRIKKLK